LRASVKSPAACRTAARNVIAGSGDSDSVSDGNRSDVGYGDSSMIAAWAISPAVLPGRPLVAWPKA
jgi:hypothetical protein